VREYEYLDVPVEDVLVGGELDLEPATESGYFTFRFRKKELRVQAGGFIGFIPLNDRLAVEVTPRCSIANLGHILRVGGFAPKVLEQFARGYAIEPNDLAALRDLYAEALLGEVAKIQAYGRLREYEQRRERTSSPRGRLLMMAPETQLAAAGGSATVQVSWFERTADLPANRCIKLAIWLLARAYAQTKNPSQAQRKLAIRLNAVYGVFEDAQLDQRMTFLRDTYVTGRATLPATRSYYRNAIDVARLVVTSSSLSFDRPGADVAMPSIVIEMHRVFESYVRTVLADGVRDDETLDVLNGNAEGRKLLYDEQPSEDATPDIVLEKNRAPVVILDVKYKPANGLPNRDDLNQVITYGVSYRASTVVLVQPRADNSDRIGLIHLGDINGRSVYQYVIDLSGELETEEAAMADAVRNLAGVDAHASAVAA
jgi:5-methylcytosine-specific restriction enzyme subunit McrC